MRAIKGDLTPELDARLEGRSASTAEPFQVSTYRELMEQVARLAYANKDHLLLFRGQARDFKNKAGAPSFYPIIYRGERLSREELALRFDVLESSGRRLVDAFRHEKTAGAKEIARRKYIRWSILQHSEVCPTPLLDFTQSVSVACSFATPSAGGLGIQGTVCGTPQYTDHRAGSMRQWRIPFPRLLPATPN